MARRCNLTEEEARSLDSVAGDLDFLLVVIPAGVALEVEDNNSAQGTTQAELDHFELSFSSCWFNPSTLCFSLK